MCLLRLKRVSGMPGGCCEGACAATKAADDRLWRKALWVALTVNASMFAVEIAAGVAADSQALKADALDFLGDAANYLISLLVVGMTLAVRAKAALVKGASLIAFGLWVLGSALWAAYTGVQPQAVTMGVIGFCALAANVGVAWMLYRFREGDANRRSVWICSRNDAIGNVAVIAAALAVAATSSAWPDLLVAAVMAGLFLNSSAQILLQAWHEYQGASAQSG